MRYDLRDSARRRDQINLMRLDRLVPALMAEHEIDCWVVTSREYADDSVVMTMLPAGWFSSRRRSILVFLRDGLDVERISVARYATDGLFEVRWDPASQPDQWEALADLLRDRSPQKIAINLSHDFAHGDGLTHGEFLLLEQALGDEMARRLVPADQLSVNWLETRIPEERETMRTACRETHQILRRALSVEAIEVGVTTTGDVGWWLRREVQELGTDVWFHPTVSLQREGDQLRDSFVSQPGSRIIQPGDLVHIDFGIVWDGLCTDQQQQGFVLGRDCPEVPTWVESALNTGNQLQDLLTGQFRLGRTGNEILESTLQAAKASGIDGLIYTHPIGFHGHGAGPPIGLWDNQIGIPGPGDRTLRAGTAWSIELMAKVQSEAWNGQTVSIMLEEDAWFDGEVVEYLDGRQTEIWAIG